jgi:hypothetical protein
MSAEEAVFRGVFCMLMEQSTSRIAGPNAIGQFLFPLIHQRPVQGTGAEIGHVKVPFQAGDRCSEKLIILAENRTVAGQ